MSAHLRLLLFADDARRASRIERDLRRPFEAVQVTPVGDDETLRQALKGSAFDLAVIDYPLSWTDSHAALRVLRERHPDRAIVLLVAADDETAALRALDVGDVDSYAVKTAAGFDRLMMGYPDRRTALAVRTPDLYVNLEDRERRRLAGCTPRPRSGCPELEPIANGADVIKVLATASIRDGGAPTMSYEQVEAACGEAKKLGKRSALHAQSPEGAIMAVRAGCTQVEHGARLSEEAIDMMAKAGTYFDPNNGLLFHTAPCRVAL